jgi:hypothetical protein
MAAPPSIGHALSRGEVRRATEPPWPETGVLTRELARSAVKIGFTSPTGHFPPWALCRLSECFCRGARRRRGKSASSGSAMTKRALAIDLDGRLVLNSCVTHCAPGGPCEPSQREFPIGIAVHWKQTPGRPYRNELPNYACPIAELAWFGDREAKLSPFYG